tara:strand:- start:648 stop:839 length:192 start_codon:yes stop_codon:yes gene_type:complete
MSLETDFYSHQASCDERYKNIEEKLEAGKSRMTRIEYLIYIVIAAVLLGPGFAAEVVKKLLGL